MPRRGRPERWGISVMKIGDEVTCTRKQLTYIRQRFYKYKYKMVYRYDGDNVTCIRKE